MSDRDDIIDRLAALFAGRGAAAYFGEPVSVAGHMLQAAAMAARDGAPAALVAAALLHDVGHLLHDLAEDCADRGIDDRHEDSGAAFLAGAFPAAVTEPIRLHVAAKRHLCTVEPGYAARLSPASVQSLALQGGPMTPDEAAAFAAGPHAAAAVALRRLDEAAKIPDMPAPGFDAYRSLLESLRLA